MEEVDFLTPQAFKDISQQIGLPIDLLKTIFVILASIVLAPIFHLLKRPIYRILYSFIPSFFLLIFLLQEWFLYLLTMSLISYVIIKIVPKKQFVFALLTSFFFLLFIHSYRFIFDYKSWKIDCSVLVMYMVTKICYFSLFVTNKEGKSQFLPFLGYCFYFPGVSIGPTFSFKTYLNFISRQENFKNIPFFRNSVGINFVKTICLAILTIYLMPIFTPYWVLQNETYLGWSTIVKFLSLNVIGVCYRLKFYSAWGLAQIAVDFSGLSWNSKSEEFDGVKTGSFLFQLEINPKKKTQYWNTSVQQWLKDCFYDPIFAYTKSTLIATYSTFLVSAFWHGIYWTYYLGFVQWAMIIQITKWVYKMSLTFNEKLMNSFAMKFIAFFMGAILMNYTGMFIVVLTWDQAVRFYSDLQYIGTHILVVFFIASFVVIPKKKKIQKI